MPVCFESLELENEALGSQKRHTENSKQSGQSKKQTTGTQKHITQYSKKKNQKFPK